MNKLSRSTALKIAAVIVLVLALLDMIVYEIPFLTSGMAVLDLAANADQGPPFFMVLLSFAVDVLAIVAAYGAWRAQRWGVILVIVISAFNSINNALAAVFAPWMATRIFAAVSVIVYLGVIYLCLRREPKALAESV
jgi:hypothetical protein